MTNKKKTENEVFEGILKGTQQVTEIMTKKCDCGENCAEFKESKNPILKFKKLDVEAKIPIRKYSTDAGMDIFALNDEIILPHFHKIVKTGITIDFPDNTVAFVWPKSRAEFLVGAGVIDSSYQGEILVKVFNPFTTELEIKKHQGIAQIVIVPVLCPAIEEVDEIHQEETERGETGGIAGNAR